MLQKRLNQQFNAAGWASKISWMAASVFLNQGLFFSLWQVVCKVLAKEKID